MYVITAYRHLNVKIDLTFYLTTVIKKTTMTFNKKQQNNSITL